MSKYEPRIRSHDCGLLKPGMRVESANGRTWRLLVPIGEDSGSEISLIISDIYCCPFCGHILLNRR